jgi:hypothetical protein
MLLILRLGCAAAATRGGRDERLEPARDDTARGPALAPKASNGARCFHRRNRSFLIVSLFSFHFLLFLTLPYIHT